MSNSSIVNRLNKTKTVYETFGVRRDTFGSWPNTLFSDDIFFFSDNTSDNLKPFSIVLSILVSIKFRARAISIY